MFQLVDGPIVYSNISVTTTATELKVGGSALEDRKVVLVQAKGNNVFIGTDSSVTTSNGIEIFKNQIIPLELGPAVTLYAIANAGSIDVRIWEMA